VQTAIFEILDDAERLCRWTTDDILVEGAAALSGCSLTANTGKAPSQNEVESERVC
jgi:hypothetical protein